MIEAKKSPLIIILEVINDNKGNILQLTFKSGLIIDDKIVLATEALNGSKLELIGMCELLQIQNIKVVQKMISTTEAEHAQVRVIGNDIDYYLRIDQQDILSDILGTVSVFATLPSSL